MTAGKDSKSFIIELHVNGIFNTLVKWFLVGVSSTDMLEDGLMVLRVYMVDMDMDLAKEMLKEENYLSLAMKRSCV